MVSTKHCCWGECKSDARYPEKLPKHLQEMMAAGQKVFLPFPKASEFSGTGKMSAMGHSLFEGEFHCQEYYKKHIHMPTSLARRKRANRRIPRPSESQF